MTEQLTPPPELVEQWYQDGPGDQRELVEYVATQAARWGANRQLKLDAEQINKVWQAGADVELEACCEWLMAQKWFNNSHIAVIKDLRAARRPKPPSLKEQALMALEDGDTGPGASLTTAEVCIIRRALEQLPND